MTYACLLNDCNAEILAGKNIVKTCQDLYVAITNKDCQELVIYDDFARAYYTPSGLKKFIANLKLVSPYCKVELKTDYIKEFDEDIKLILALKDPEDLITYVLNNRKDGFQLIQKLASEYNKSYTESLEANSKLSTMHLQIAEAEKRANTEKQMREKLAEQLALTQSRLDTLVSRIQYTYGKYVSDKNTFGYDINVTSYHKILYIKEITRVRYIDTLLYYLKEIIKTLHGQSVRFVVIEAPYAYTRAELYPTCKPHIKLTARDVYKEDIFMAGFQARLMGDILQNANRSEYLFILDRSGFKDCYVRGKHVNTYYTISDLKDAPNEVNGDNVICYKKDLLHVPYVAGFNDAPMEEKIMNYSSFTITKILLDELME